MLLTLYMQPTFGDNRFPMAIVPGDYADPSILRDGDDYYMTHSPFIYKPGFLIWHSKDLSTWTPVTRALSDWNGSAMAPDLVKHNGKYYIYFPSGGTNYVTVADNMDGPWSDPIDLKISGIDPGHVVDGNGNRFLFVNEGEMVALSADGLSTLSEKRKVYDGWDIPSGWVTEGKYLESPKLLKKGGYYYIVSAEGGTAGPPTSHMVIVARSKSLDGPWENSPYNPLVHTYSDSEEWWSKGHGTLVDDTDGNWWVVYHGYANNNHALGRQTLIEPVEWTSDGWVRPAASDRFLPPSATSLVTLDDDFESDSLGWQWTLWKDYTPSAISFGDGRLTLKGRGGNPGDATVLLTTAMHGNYMVETEISLYPESRGGLMLFYSEEAYAGVMADLDNIYIYSGKGEYSRIPNTMGGSFRVRLQNRGNRLHAYVSQDGDKWELVADGIDVSHMNHKEYKKFFALRPALVAEGDGSVSFDSFRYTAY